jgi:ribosomal protein L31
MQFHPKEKKKNSAGRSFLNASTKQTSDQLWSTLYTLLAVLLITSGIAISRMHPFYMQFHPKEKKTVLAVLSSTPPLNRLVINSVYLACTVTNYKWNSY